MKEFWNVPNPNGKEKECIIKIVFVNQNFNCDQQHHLHNGISLCKRINRKYNKKECILSQTRQSCWTQIQGKLK